MQGKHISELADNKKLLVTNIQLLNLIHESIIIITQI